MLTSEETRRIEEAGDLINLIMEGNKSQLSSEESQFVGKIILKLKSSYSKFSNKEIFWLRDLKDKCL